MGSRRPPEILRKSHAHVAGKARAKAKAALKEELESETDVEERGGGLADNEEAPPRDDKHPGRD
jgi:hypothetical protein